MSRKQIVILGAGTGGTMVANRLRRRFDPDEAEIHAVDRDDRHVYQPGPALRPLRARAGRRDREAAPAPAATRSRLHRNEVEEVWTERDEVPLDDGTVLPYDVLVIATGVRLQPERQKA